MFGRIPSIAFVLALTAIAAEAAADCNISIRGLRTVRFTGADEYHVFNPEETAQTATFRVRHRRSDACDFFVTFSEGGAGTFDRYMSDGGETLDYQIYDTPSKSNILKDLPSATAGEVLSGSFGTEVEEVELSFYVAIPPLQVKSDDVYDDRIRVTLYEGDLADFVQRDAKDLTILARIRPTVEVCIVPCGAPFDPEALSFPMNFGTLEESEFMSADVLVRANVDYRLMYESEFRGVMTHVTEPGSEVPYETIVNGSPIDLGRPRVIVAEEVGPTTPAGNSYQTTITIGSTDNAAAGDHEDNITITVRAR